MQKFNVTGMSCAACSARVESAVNSVEGVTSCSVSLLTNSMGVDGDVDEKAIIKAVEAAGYGAKVMDETLLEDTETPKLKKRLFTSLGFLLVLMYFSMGVTMWHFPVPAFIGHNAVIIGVIQMVLAVIIMVINRKFFISGVKGLMNKAPNMDTLVSLGSLASFIYSFCVLILKPNIHEYYFESAAMILVLITVGKTLEAHSKGKTTDALKSLMELAPKTATLLVNGTEKVVPAEDVQIGDIFVVKSGENIPVDGEILEGEAAIDESALTGESVPVDKTVGEAISAATTNTSGYIRCQATRVGDNTTLSQIIKMVSDAAATKAPIAKIADKVSGVFVPVVISIAVITTIIWLIVGSVNPAAIVGTSSLIGFALARGISVLVISCPCALGLATPVAIMVGNGVGAKNGILFKTAVSLENAGKGNIVVLDKTGTITQGQPKVVDVVPNAASKSSSEDLLSLAYSIEKMSEHPLARAIVTYGEENSVKPLNLTGFKTLAGSGVEAVIDESNKKVHVYAGNLKFVTTKATIPENMIKKSDELAAQGKTPLFFIKGNEIVGIIAVADVIKEDSPAAIKELKNMGVRVVMLTGDNEKTAKTIGDQVGVDEVVASVLPDGKEEVVRNLKKEGQVIMVGDGINDAPALTSADTGIAIGAGTDVAIDAADIVLVNSKLSDIPAAIRLSRYTITNIHENLAWAFIYNIIGIPLAAGAFIHAFGWAMNPMFGAAAMSLSSFCVVTNALRINLFDIHNSKRDKKIKNKNTNRKVEEEVPQDNGDDIECFMTKVVKIEGMMCPHCEATVKKVTEEFPEVDVAFVSHKKGTATLKLNADIDEEKVKAAIEEKGYKVKGFEVK